MDGINPARICIANIFSGPIEVHNEVPRNLPYYKLIQESELGNFIYDFASENTYKEDIAKVLKSIFPAERWVKNIEISIPETTIKKEIIEIDNDVEKNIVDFLKEEEGGILVLESMNSDDRDVWLRFIANESVNHNIPQIETWSHSARISKKIQTRSNMVWYGTSEQNHTKGFFSKIEILEKTSEDMANEISKL
ncbi:hypothetical protein [Sphingobacterium lumbrici]|uniref:hypothetical protein n=1 Tax=Sphingobacterium lumbrici TaxID=2559600 RepID=UPI00112E145A|nr:hypothetical protein [Sphingobacterium lumbrici]